MAGDPPTQLIEQGELRMLVEATRVNTDRAHVIRRARGTVAPNFREPSALRGLLWVVIFAWLAREVVHFFQ
jgi:hypothetical protein